MKQFLFDVDGVLIIAPFFTKNLHDKYGVPEELTSSFIHGEYQKCIVGEEDLKKILPKYIAEWGLSLSVDELLGFWFKAEDKPNLELIRFIQTLRQKGYQCSVATNQEQYRVKYIRQNMQFDQYFDNFFASPTLHVKKPAGEYFAKITELLKTNPKDIYFFDDRLNYVEAANGKGWNGFTFTTTENCIQQIKKVIESSK